MTSSMGSRDTCATRSRMRPLSGSASDSLDWQPHIRSKGRRDELAKRFKKATDPLRLVIVRDMWLTGFDVLPLHTMYVDKPMRGHGLMQAIARVNRVFRDKPGGLVVDYLGLADELRRALPGATIPAAAIGALDAFLLERFFGRVPAPLAFLLHKYSPAFRPPPKRHKCEC